MIVTQNIIKHHDTRTGKSYAVLISHQETAAQAMERMVQIAERDYQKSLPPEQRLVANQPTDFKCPYCRSFKQPSQRKEKIINGFLFWVRTSLIDIFKCVDCNREFRDSDLSWERERVSNQNWRALCLELYKDGEISEEVMIKASTHLTH